MVEGGLALVFAALRRHGPSPEEAAARARSLAAWGNDDDDDDNGGLSKRRYAESVGRSARALLARLSRSEEGVPQRQLLRLSAAAAASSSASASASRSRESAADGTAAAIGLIIGVPGAIVFVMMGFDAPLRVPYSLGYVSLPAFVLISLGTIFAAPFGVRLAHALPAQTLRRAFALFLVATAIRMAWGLVG